jgi:hypothetical protein
LSVGGTLQSELKRLIPEIAASDVGDWRLIECGTNCLFMYRRLPCGHIHWRGVVRADMQKGLARARAELCLCVVMAYHKRQACEVCAGKIDQEGLTLDLAARLAAITGCAEQKH